MDQSIVVFDLTEESDLPDKLIDGLDARRGQLERRRFPDGETWLRIGERCQDKPCLVVASLDDPDVRTLPVLFLAEALRSHGASEVGLAAPYLPYMRQDREFSSGEVVTSRYYADLLSTHFDWLTTVDPHLHRHDSLDDLYSMPTTIAHAASAIAGWLAQLDDDLVIVGPDAESRQWVEAVAEHADSPFIILEKERLGDRDVELTAEGLTGYSDHHPIVLDDIISTGSTMLETVSRLSAAGYRASICVGIHAVFSDDAMGLLLDAGAERVVTCNTISHPTNAIDVSVPLAEAIQQSIGSDD